MRDKPRMPARTFKKKSRLARVTHSEFPVVGIGASAAGLSALSQFLKYLPAGIGMPIVIIQDLDPRHGSLTADILSRLSSVPVSDAFDGMRLDPDHIYVIPPNCSLRISKGFLKV